MSVADHDTFASAILLAAATAGDPDARMAALDPALRARVEAVSASLTTERSRGRDHAVTALVARAADAPTAAHAPARARAIVATLVARAIGAEWLRDAGVPRAGFRASAGLRTTVAHTPEDAWRA